MRGFVTGIILLTTIAANAQKFAPKDYAKLKRQEDSMKVYGEKMINERTALQRFLADSSFTKTLVRALKTPNSFHYPFDSLLTVSHIYAPDSSFRIITWQFTRDEDYYWQRGAIQMRTADGSLKLFPLHDVSNFTSAPQDSIRTGKNWIGCIYYGIVMKTINERKFFTLLGFDDNNMRSSKKWIEVLYFDEMGNPQFGGPFFSIPSGNIRAGGGGRQARFVLEYKKDGKARMNYDKELDMIMFDHLVSEDGKTDKPYTYVPDGDYQGFKWMSGKWVQVDKVFNQKLEDWQAPMPKPVKDVDGKSNEQMLMRQSEKNSKRLKELPINAPVKKQVLPPLTKPQPSKEKEESY